MKRVLRSLIIVIALAAAVIIPIDVINSHKNSSGGPTESSAVLEKKETSRTESEEESESEPELESSESGDIFLESEELVSNGALTSSRTSEPAPQESEPNPVSPPAAPRAQESSPAAPKPESSQPSPPSRPAASAPASSKPNPVKPIVPTPESSQPASSKPETPGTGEGNATYVQQVVQLVNQERAKAGLNPLSIHQSAESAALVRAKEIEISFSHTRPNGSNFVTALSEKGVNYRSAGENIAWGQKTPAQVMDGWMNSSGHRANILNPKFTGIGVGYYRNSSGVNYWTQLFIG